MHLTFISLCVPLYSRTDFLRCSFNLVCLVAPAHHEDYGLSYIRRLCFYCLGALCLPLILSPSRHPTIPHYK